MANNTYKQHLENLLKQDARFVDDEGELMGNKVKSFTDDLDEKLIELLLQDEASREQFFIKIKEVYVFKASEFKFFLEQNKIDNSFTNYINQIGLSVGGKFIKDNTDVVLDFPYKDCILEGGQSTEEGLDTYFEYDEEVSKPDAKKGYKPQQYNEKQTKRKEIFFNNIVAKDEIDRLLEPKAFANITKYDVNGESKPTSFTRDAAINKKRGLPADTITDNLIIKGNNLLALKSLEQEFIGKVKLIYIDPPYNTGSDSFAYNDNFNHSSWLTFMKNRLDRASKLLTSDGVVIVQCSFHQFAYLKVLMSDLFKNHLCDFNIQVRHPDRALTGDKEYNDIMEYALIFSNHPERKMPFIEIEKTEVEYVYKVEIKDNVKPDIINCGEKTVEVYLPEMYSVSKVEADPKLYKKISIRGSIREKNSSGRFFVKYLEKLKDYPSETLFKVPDMGDDVESHRYFYSAPKGKKNGGYYQGMPTSTNITKKKYPNYYNFEKAYNTVSNQGGVEFRNGKKPEELLKFLINIFSNKLDLVLDYHLGSGTTGAVAHKMKRQYIGCEQMQNQIDLSLARLKNVIKGDDTGISKDDDIKWQGGGLFTYLELAKNNQNAKDSIMACNSYKELMELFNNLYTNYFLHYNLKIKEFKEVVAKEEKYIALPLEKQKEVFCKMLDNNQLYVNVSEMEDSKHNIAPEDIALTKDFYQIKE